MTHNPYHHPETAAAIWNVAMNGGLRPVRSRQLLDLIEGAELMPPISHKDIIRSIEIVLARVKMAEPMRRDAMWALARERGNAQRRAQYAGAEDLSAGQVGGGRGND